MIRRDHLAQARLLSVKAQGINLSRSPWSTPGPLASSSSLKDAYPQGRAHAQSPGNPVRLPWLPESHDVIQTRIHDQMSQPLCLTPTQFGNNEVLRQQRDAFSTTTKCCIFLMHNNIVLHQIKMPYALQHSTASTKTPYVLSHTMSRKERTYPVTSITSGYDYLLRVPVRVNLAQSSHTQLWPLILILHADNCRNNGKSFSSTCFFGLK
jgi:hypothetical protein